MNLFDETNGMIEKFYEEADEFINKQKKKTIEIKDDLITKERNEAFSSLDKEKIITYCKKYNIPIPENDTVFWMGVHKAICQLYVISKENSGITLDMYNKSYEWLIRHGSTPSIE